MLGILRTPGGSTNSWAKTHALSTSMYPKSFRSNIPGVFARHEISFCRTHLSCAKVKEYICQIYIPTVNTNAIQVRN